MKRPFLLLALLVSLFVSCNKEDPNEAFVGGYRGTLTVTQKISTMGGTFSLEPQTQPCMASIVKGKTANEIIATFIIEGITTEELRGVISDKNVVTFDPVDFDYDIIEDELEGMEIVKPFNMTLMGTLSNDCLNLIGELTGQILISDTASSGLPMNMPINIITDITGALNKEFLPVE